MFENAGSKALSIVKVYVIFELIVTFIVGMIYSIQYATVTKYSMYYEYNNSSEFKVFISYADSDINYVLWVCDGNIYGGLLSDDGRCSLLKRAKSNFWVQV